MKLGVEDSKIFWFAHNEASAYFGALDYSGNHVFRSTLTGTFTYEN